jgi:hypothetical protein
MSVTLPIGISRTCERMTLIGCVCADGSHRKPMMTIRWRTIDADDAFIRFVK